MLHIQAVIYASDSESTANLGQLVYKDTERGQIERVGGEKVC
jgi:hypothetical protein